MYQELKDTLFNSIIILQAVPEKFFHFSSPSLLTEVRERVH